MARKVGTSGVVKIGNNTVAAVTSFTIDETAETVQDTALGESAHRYQTDRTSWTASIECMWDKADTTGQEAMTAGALVELHLLPEGDNTGDNDVTGDAIITNIGRSVSSGAMITRTYQLQGTGDLTEAALS